MSRDIQDITSDNEGISLGKVGGYVKRFKEQEKTNSTISFNPKEEFNTKKSSSLNGKNLDPNILPEEINKDNEKTVYVYYYTKFGNLDCDDFNLVKGKIASAINRLYNLSVKPDEALDKLEKYVTPADIGTYENEKKEYIEEKKDYNIKKEEKINVTLMDGEYSFISGLKPLTKENLDLCSFVDKSNLCFSSDGYSFFLSVKPGKENCFENLFNFNQKELVVFNMFKEQLGDEHKAKKLVLMSKLLSSENEDNSKIKKLKNNLKASK